MYFLLFLLPHTIKTDTNTHHTYVLGAGGEEKETKMERPLEKAYHLNTVDLSNNSDELDVFSFCFLYPTLSVEKANDPEIPMAIEN